MSGPSLVCQHRRSTLTRHRSIDLAPRRSELTIRRARAARSGHYALVSDESSSSIVHDVLGSAEWISAALRSSGYAADFSPSSLWEVDRFFDEHTEGGRPRRRGLLAESTGSRLFGIGSYIGEVIRRNVGGEWEGDDSDPEAEINVAVRLSDGSLIWPVQRAMKRLQNGAEDAVAPYASVLGVSVGRAPASRPRASRWLRRGRGNA
jgi:hypothetical protein